MKVLLADGQDILPGHKKTRVVVQTLHANADQHSQYLFLQEAASYRSAQCSVQFSCCLCGKLKCNWKTICNAVHESLD